MSPRVRFGIAVVGLVIGLVMFSGYMASQHRAPEVDPDPFVEAVDLSAFSGVAVQTQGRIKSFESFANGIMGFILGPRKYAEQSSAFTYMDMLARPERYTDADIIYVKNKRLRTDIARVLEDQQQGDGPSIGFTERMATFKRRGLLSPRLLSQPAVQRRLSQLGTDLMRSAKFVQNITFALQWRDPSRLYGELAMIPPGGDDPFTPWGLIGTASRRGGLEPDLAVAVDEQWAQLQTAWRAEDAAGVNASASALAELLPSLNPALYPNPDKLQWESWYFQQGNLTWIWKIYMLSVVLLLLGFVYDWRAAGIAGMVVFIAAFLMQSGALGLRWWISGRWPNSNMFEAVTTSAWFGGLLALAFEFFGRKRSLRRVFALTSATASMVALMCAHYMPLQLNPNIGNMMPVLHNVWLYIHTNVIIWSYILIFMAAVSGMLYLLYRATGGERGFVSDSAPLLGVAGTNVALDADRAGVVENAPREARSDALAAASPAVDVGAGQVGSTAGLAAMAGGGSAGAQGLGPVLDGVTMALMKLSFVMLWAGLVMGAIWADHSWGRPWGWDPKEVFALNTFLVFAVLVHVRWKTRDKALWTAWLAVAGAVVMLFNWIVINFYISGLHSYA